MMNCCECNCRRFSCSFVAVIASIILGVIAAFFRISGGLTLSPVILAIAFGVALLFLAITLALSPFARDNVECICDNLRIFLTGILGTILTSVILLLISFVATSIIGAIITGLLVAFFSLIVTSVVCLIKCFLGCE